MFATSNNGKLNQNYCTLTPAYGRDYKSAKEVKADFEANKDFVLQPTGQYINKDQIETGITVNLRYKRLQEVTVIKVK